MNNTTDDLKRKKALERIRALMQRTTANGHTEAEAEQAAAMMDRLMAEYEIDLTETTVGTQEIIRVDIALNRHPVRFAAVRLAEFCDCRVWYDDTDGKQNICFLGLEIDTEVVEYLFLLFQRAIDREIRQYSMFNPDLAFADAAQTKHMVESFAHGMASRLGDRVLALKSKRDFSQKAGGFDLVLAKKPLVDEAFASLGLSLGLGDKYRGSHRHHGAYAAGQSAGDKVAINQGVGGSNASGTGRIR